VKQVGPTNDDVPSSAFGPPIREKGEPTTRVDPSDDEVAKVTSSMPHFVLAKRKCDDRVGVSGRKKSRVPFSL